MSLASQVGKLPHGLQAHDFEGYRHHHFLVVGLQDAIRHLEVLQSSLAPLGLVWEQATHHQKKDAAVSPKVVGPPRGVDVDPLEQKGQLLRLISIEIVRNVDALSAHGHRVVVQQHLIGHDGRQAAQEMARTCPSAIFGSLLGKDSIIFSQYFKLIHDM